LEQHKQWGAPSPLANELTSDDVILELWERRDGFRFITATKDGVTCIVASQKPKGQEI
jgi:hypothetical protein